MEPVQLVVRATARLYQRISALFILSGAFVGLSFFLLYFLVNSSYLFPLFDGVVNPQLRGRIGFERVVWGPAPWSLKILQPKVWSPVGKEIFRSESLIVDEIHLRGLLDKKLEVTGVTIQTGRADFTARLSQESLDLLGQPKPLFDIEEAFWPPGPRYDDGEKVGVTVDVEDIHILDLSVRLDMPEAAIIQDSVTIRGANFEAQPDHEYLRMSVDHLQSSAGELRVRKEDDGPPPFEGEPESYYHWPTKDFDLKNYTWRNEIFNVGTVTLTVRGDPLRVDRYRMDLTVPGEPSMGGKVHLEIADLHQHLAPFGLSEIRGPMVLDVSGRGPTDAFAGRFEVDGHQLTLFGESVDRLRIGGIKAEAGSIRLDRLEITALKGLIEGTAEFDPSKGNLSTDISLDGVEIGALQAEVPETITTLAAGRWEGVVRFRARGLMGEDPEYGTDGRLRSTVSARRGKGLGKSIDLDWAVSFAEPIASIHTFVLVSDQLRLTAKGRLDLVGGETRLKGYLNARDLAPITHDLQSLPLTGALEAPWTLRGPLATPRVEALVTGTQLRYGEYPPVDFSSQLTFDKSRLVFEPGGTEIQVGDGNAILRGHINVLRPNTPLKLKVAARGIELGPFPLGVPLTGQLFSNVSLSGSTKTLFVEGQVKLGKPCLTLPNNEPLCFRRIDAVGEWEGDEIGIKRLTVDGPKKPTLSASGTVNIENENFVGHLKLDKISLPWVARMARPYKSTPLPLRGTVSVELEAEGKFRNPLGAGRVEFDGLGYDQYNLGNGVLGILAENEALAVEGKLFDKFRVDAKIPIQADSGLAKVKVAFDSLAIEDFLPQLVNQPLETEVAGTVEVDANLLRGALHAVTAKLKTLRATYTLPADSKNRADTEKAFVVSNVDPVQISLRHGVVNIDNFLLSVDRAGGVGVSSPSASLAPIVGRSLGSPAGLLAGVANIATNVVLPVIEGSTLPINETWVKVTGTMGTDLSLDLAALGIINLDLVQPFLASVFTEMSGYTRFALRLGGSADDPLAEGQVVLYPMQAVPRSGVVGGQIELKEKATFSILPQVGPFFRQDGTLIGGVIDLRLADFDRFGSPILGPASPMRLFRDEAELTVSDITVDFKEFIPHRVILEASFVEQYLNIPRVLRATVSGKDIKFEMSQERDDGARLEEPIFLLSGALRLLHGSYIADVDIQPTSGVTNNVIGKTQQQSVDAFEENPALRRLKLDLSLMGDGDFRIKNHISVLAPDLDIRIKLDAIKGFLAPQPETGDLADGTWEPLEIRGRVTILPDSTLTYSNRVFEVTRGFVDFSENAFVNAELEATKTFRLRTGTSSSAGGLDTQSGDVQFEEVKLSVSFFQQTPGSPHDLKLFLASNSGASQLEVATLVLTGSRPSAITGAGGASGAAAGLLLAPIMNLVERPLEDTFDLELDVSPSSTGQLFIGSELVLSQRLTLSTKVLVGDADEGQSQSVGVEYRVNNVLFGEFNNQQTDTDSATTLRLQGKWEFD